MDASPISRDDFLAHSKEDRENFNSIHSKLDKIVSDHPTNGELGIMIANVAKDVSEIKVQTTKTNGRVTILEVSKDQAIGRSEGSRALWGWIVGGASFLIMVINFSVQCLKSLPK